MTAAGDGRGVGLAELLHGSAEIWVIALFGFLTQLGDVWFLFLLGGALYVVGDADSRWRVDRRRALFVFGLVLAYLSLIVVLKGAFSLPRPPGAGDPAEVRGIPVALEALFENTTTASGPGFPSGHALGSAMVWGGLALVFDEESIPVRFGVAATVVALVSLARLVLGVHYAVDVVVGAAIGAATLGALYRLTDRATVPGRVLLVASVVGVVGVLAHATFDTAATAGGALGGWIAWRGVADLTPDVPMTRREVRVGAAVLALSAALFGVVYAVRPPVPVAFVAAALATGSVVCAPLVGERTARR